MAATRNRAVDVRPRLAVLIQDEGTNEAYTIIVTETLTPRHENTRRMGDVVPTYSNPRLKMQLLISGCEC
jgi:hypothetical protein